MYKKESNTIPFPVVEKNSPRLIKRQGELNNQLINYELFPF